MGQFELLSVESLQIAESGVQKIMEKFEEQLLHKYLDQFKVPMSVLNTLAQSTKVVQQVMANKDPRIDDDLYFDKTEYEEPYLGRRDNMDQGLAKVNKMPIDFKNFENYQIKETVESIF